MNKVWRIWAKALGDKSGYTKIKEADLHRFYNEPLSFSQDLESLGSVLIIVAAYFQTLE